MLPDAPTQQSAGAVELGGSIRRRMGNDMSKQVTKNSNGEVMSTTETEFDIKESLYHIGEGAAGAVLGAVVYDRLLGGQSKGLCGGGGGVL